MLGRNIKKLRTEYEISQRRLADYMHIKEEQLQEWEQGKSFPNDEQLSSGHSVSGKCQRIV